MLEFDTIILGGGASGCMCALISKNKNIAIIDKESKIAKKLLVTGNGRCNITNLNMDSKFYNKDISMYLKRFNNEKSLDFFKKLGLLTYADEQGRVYPISNTAKSVVNVFENAFKKLNTKFFLENEIKKVEQINDKFVITTDKNQFLCNKLVVATGKNEFIDMLNIKYNQFYPSLCSLKTNNTHNLNNVRIRNVQITAYCNNKTKRDCGEILFKESGISGISIFNVSTLFAREKNYNGKISIDLMPNIDKENLIKYLMKRREIDVEISYFFDGMLAREIAYEILNRAQINENKSSLQLTTFEIKKFANYIKNLEFVVKGFYENNQVSSGGIDLQDLDYNLQHKKTKNLYFCGEICDVDGECGGYNLQWAWTSGFIVGNII